MSDTLKSPILGLMLSKEERLFGMVEFAIFQDESDVFRAVSEWDEARELLIESHFDLLMIDESAVGNVTFEAFSSFVQTIATENTTCALFVRSMTPELMVIQKSLGSVLHFVDMNKGKRAFLESLKALRKLASQARENEEQRRQTASLDDAIGRIEVSLPLNYDGPLDETSFCRLIYTVSYFRFFGKLTLTHASGASVTIEVVEGRFVHCTPAIHQVLDSFFANPEGSFHIVEDPTIETSLPEDAIEPVDLIWEGLSQKADIRLLRKDLISYHQCKLIPTNLYQDRLNHYADIQVLVKLVDACKRYQNLGVAIGELNFPEREILAAAFFAIKTDLLVVQQRPGQKIAQVVYPREVRQARQKITDYAKKKTKAFRSSSSNLQRAIIEDELRERAERFETASPYEILGVWEGCGKNAVIEAFYKAVREHHPDTYGGNVSAETKKLADRVFVDIQKARTELLRRERNQTRPKPDNFDEQTGGSASSAASSFSSPSLAEPSDLSNSQSQANSYTVPDIPNIEDHLTSLGAEVTDPEIRKQRIRALHEKRRQLSSVSNVTTPLAQKQLRSYSSEFSSFGPGLEGESFAQVSSPAFSSTGFESTGRLDRLSNRHRGISNSNSFVSVAEGVVAEGYAEFEKGNWEEAIRQLSIAKRHCDDKKIDAFLAFARYMVDSRNRNDAIRQLDECSSVPEVSYDANRFLGKIYQDSEEWLLAKGCYERAYSEQQDEVLKKSLELVQSKISESRRSESLLGRWFTKKR